MMAVDPEEVTVVGETIHKSEFSRRLRSIKGHPAADCVRRILMPGLRWIIALALLVYVLVTLQFLGWTAVWEALPGRWTFYAVVALLFMVQPIADLVIYRRLWRIGPMLGPTVMLRKRFLNSMVLDYSGEAWLFNWARRHMSGQEAFILHTIKDSNLLSSSASLLILIALIVGLVAAVPQQILLSNRDIAIFTLLATVTILPVVGYLVARRGMTTLPASDLKFVFAVHLTRSVLNNSLAVLAWSLGLPDASLLSLMELLALRLLVSRVPLLGNKDLALLGTSLGLAGALKLPQAGIAAMLLAVLTIDQLLNLICVGLPMLAGCDLVRRRAGPAK